MDMFAEDPKVQIKTVGAAVNSNLTVFKKIGIVGGINVLTTFK